MKIFSVLWLILMLTLSHIPGGPSSEESKWLSSMTGLKEVTLRRGMHLLLYVVLGCLISIAWPETELWVKAIALFIFGFVDELTKIPIPGRHFCFTPDVLLNWGGTVIGVAVGLLITGV